MSESTEISNTCASVSDARDSSQHSVPGAADFREGAITNSNSMGSGDPCLSSVEKAKDPDRRRSKSGRRRSGFSRGRVSLTQLSKEASAADSDRAGSELYKQIPVELPAAERLSLLSRLILRHTLEVLDKEFEDVPGFDNFKAEAVESVGATVDQMESDGSFQQACTTPSLAFNPVNLQMDNTISALTSCIKRLEKEDADWDDLVSGLETQAKDAEQQLSQLDMDHRDVPDDVKELCTSFLPQSTDLLDMEALCANTVRDVKTISLLMDDYSHSVELLNIVHKAAGKHMDSVTKTLDQANCCRSCDPKESIQQLLAN
ncbi:uncharacterized protein LOC143279809 isoform X2 [Babylonia areolata]